MSTQDFKMCCIIDLQGFQYKKSEFFCKELTILFVNSDSGNSNKGKIKHFLFNYNLDYCDLPKEFQKQVNFLKQNIHGHDWISNSECVLPYNLVTQILESEIVKNKITRIYIKGKQKISWIKKHIPDKCNVQFTDLDDFNCPSLGNLLVNNVNINHCKQHAINDLTCSRQNAVLLYNWFEETVNTSPTPNLSHSINENALKIL